VGGDALIGQKRWLPNRSFFFPEGSGSVRSGGGGNAREVRIRKTKKKGRRDDDSDDETGPPSQQGDLTPTHL